MKRACELASLQVGERDAVVARSVPRTAAASTIVAGRQMDGPSAHGQSSSRQAERSAVEGGRVGREASGARLVPACSVQQNGTVPLRAPMIIIGRDNPQLDGLLNNCSNHE